MNTGERSERIPAEEAATELGTTLPRILMLLRDGALEGVQEGNSWFVTRASLECLQAHGGDTVARSACRKTCGGSCGNHG